MPDLADQIYSQFTGSNAPGDLADQIYDQHVGGQSANASATAGQIIDQGTQPAPQMQPEPQPLPSSTGFSSQIAQGYQFDRSLDRPVDNSMVAPPIPPAPGVPREASMPITDPMEDLRRRQAQATVQQNLQEGLQSPPPAPPLPYVRMPKAQVEDAIYTDRFHQGPSNVVGDRFQDRDALHQAPDGDYLVRSDLAQAINQVSPPPPNQTPQTTGEDLRNVPANISAAGAQGVAGVAQIAGSYLNLVPRALRATGGALGVGAVTSPAATVADVPGTAMQRFGKYLAGGAQTLEQDNPIQGQVGKLAAGAGTLGIDATMAALLGPEAFTASFAGRSAGQMYQNARAQGDDDQTATAKGVTAGFTAALTPQIAHAFGPEATQPVIDQVVRSYLGTGSMVAAQSTLDELTLKAGTGQKIDLSQIFPEAASQGVIGVLMHGGAMARDRMGKASPPKDQPQPAVNQPADANEHPQDAAANEHVPGVATGISHAGSVTDAGNSLTPPPAQGDEVQHQDRPDVAATADRVPGDAQGRLEKPPAPVAGGAENEVGAGEVPPEVTSPVPNPAAESAVAGEGVGEPSGNSGELPTLTDQSPEIQAYHSGDIKPLYEWLNRNDPEWVDLHNKLDSSSESTHEHYQQLVDDHLGRVFDTIQERGEPYVPSQASEDGLAKPQRVEAGGGASENGGGTREAQSQAPGKAEKPKSKAAIERAILDHYNQFEGDALHEKAAQDEETASDFGSTTFLNKFPDEVKNELTPKEFAQLSQRKIITLTSDPSASGGEDVMAKMGTDAYVDMLRRSLESSGAGRLRAAVKFAEKSPDPQMQELAAAWREKDAISQEKADYARGNRKKKAKQETPVVRPASFYEPEPRAGQPSTDIFGGFSPVKDTGGQKKMQFETEPVKIAPRPVEETAVERRAREVNANDKNQLDLSGKKASENPLTIEDYGQGLRVVRGAGPEMDALSENWEGKKLARYNKKADGWIFSPKNEGEIKAVVDKINSARMPKPSEKAVEGAKPVESLTDAELKAEMNGATGGRLSKLIAERTKRERAADEKSGNFPVDESLLGGILQHSDTVAAYRAGDESANKEAAKGLLASPVEALKSTAHYLIDEAKRAKGSMFPTITRLGERSGDAAAHYVSARIYAKEAGPAVAKEIVGTEPGKPHKINEELDRLAGAFLAQDNLDSIKDKFIADGDMESARNMASLIGAEGSPFATRTDFAMAAMRQDVQDVIKRYKQWFAGEPEENFRVSQGIADDEELPTRGKMSEARVNLKAVLPEDPQTATTIRTSPKGNLTNPRLKPSPFARKAKGNAPSYDISLSAMIENTLGKGQEIADQHRLFKQLIRDGIAKIGKPGERPELGGKRTIPFEVEPARRFLATKTDEEGNKQTAAFGKPAKKLYVRVDAAPELRRALAVDEKYRIPVVSATADVMNKTALASLSEAAYHVGNQISALVGSPGTGLIVPGMVKQMARLWGGGVEVAKQLAELGRIGALKEQGTHGSKYNPLSWPGRLINMTDRAGRLLMDDAFSKLADKGLVKGSEQNRRDFINQFGQYNARAQQKLIAYARETSLGPFATAGTNFWALGMKKMVLSPGATASSIPSAIRLRALVLGRFAVPLAMVATANYLKWGSMTGGPNVPLGALRLDNDKDGKPRYFDVANLMGITRGARESGLQAMLEGNRRGESGAGILDKAARDVRNSAFSPIAGPLIRQAAIALTGSDVGGYQVADTAEKGKSQFVQNLKAAARTANPLVDMASGGKNGQLGPFSIKTNQRGDRTDAQYYLDQASQDRFKGLNLSPSDQAKHAAKEKLIQDIAAGGDKYKLLAEAVKDKVILNSQRGEIIREAQMSPLERKIHGPIPVEDVLGAWDKMTPKERDQTRQAVNRKIVQSKLPPEEKRAALAKIRSGVGATE